MRSEALTSGNAPRQAWRVLRGCGASFRRAMPRISVPLSRGDSGAQARGALGVQSETGRDGGNAASRCQDPAARGRRVAEVSATQWLSLKSGAERDAHLRTLRRA